LHKDEGEFIYDGGGEGFGYELIAQSVEHESLNLLAMGSNNTWDAICNRTF
jgi:hypothetical protein